MLNYDYHPRKSPHAQHGAACTKNGMTEGFQCSGQACPRICPLPQSSLATGPRFARLDAWLHEEDTWLKGSDSLCGAKTAGFSIELQNPAPQEEKLPIDQNDHRTGEFGNETTTSVGGVLTDARIKRASSASHPQTSPPHIKMTVRVEKKFLDDWW